MRRVFVFLAAIFAASSASAGVFGSAYEAAGQCGPFARAPLTTAKGMCVGIAAGPDQGLKMPRTLLEVGPGDFVLVDMGGWVGKSGRVLRLTLADGAPPKVQTLIDKLVQPHGLALGPDKKIYVGERGRVFRFDLAAPQAIETVIPDLPTDGLHPLTNLIFDKDGALIVNIGTPTDRCESKAAPQTPQDPCPFSQGDRPRAALWRFTFDKPGGKVTGMTALARGLRNSMALAFDPKSGALIQGENGVDLPGEDEPVEELNLITPGGHYGWPSCYGAGIPLPGSGLTRERCKDFTGAAFALPAHSAPLGMLVYQSQLFPELQGKLIISLHGYRVYGHRIVALDPDTVTMKSNPKAALTDVVSGWDRQRGVRPLGAPTGLTVAASGEIWFADDKNKAVMVLRRDTNGSAKVVPVGPAPFVAPPPPKGWETFARSVIKVKCAMCHAEARAGSPQGIWEKMAEHGWAGEGPLKQSKIVRALTGVGPEKPMPPPGGLKMDPAAVQALQDLLAANP